MSDPNRRPPIERLLAHAGWVRRLGRSLLADPNQVDDAVQETWVAALEHPAETVRDDRAWLGGVFRNVLRQRQRTEARRSRRESDSARAEALPAAGELVERAELQEKILQAVLRLPEPYRATLLLRYFEELSAEEIARRERVPASTVRNRQRRALALLRERFGLDDEGARRQWALMLLPLGPSLPIPPLPQGTGGPESALAQSVPAGTAVSASTTTTGVLAMSLKALAATLLVLTAGWGTSFAYRQVTEHEAGGAAGPRAAQSSAAADETVVQSALAPVAAPRSNTQDVEPAPRGAADGQGRQVIEVVDDASAPRVHGRVVDENGRPLAGVPVFVGGRPSPFHGKIEAALQLVFERMKRDAERKRAIERELRTQEKMDEGARTERMREHAAKLEQVHAEELARAKKEAAERHAAERPSDDEPRAPRRTASSAGELKEREAKLETHRALLAQAEAIIARSVPDPRTLEKPFEDLAHVRELERHAPQRPELFEEAALVLGRVLETDAEGRFSVELPEPARVYVTLYATPGILPRQLGAWHERNEGTPGEEITLEARRLPTATVSIGVRDETTGDAVPRWRGVLHEGERPLVDWDVAGRFEHVVELPSEDVTTYTAAVREPEWAHGARRFELRPGDDVRVDVVVQSGAGTRGVVVDAFGHPIAGAFVYGGDWTDIRDDTIFGTYDPERVIGAVRTDAAGAFHLPGRTHLVTAWHPAHSAATVRADEAGRIRLDGRATITGRVPLDAPRNEHGERVVLLDRSERQRAVADESGYFAFEDVEAGVHGLQLQGGAFQGVHVRPGETLHVTWDDIVPGAVVELEAGGVAVQGSMNGYVAHLADVFTQAPFRTATKGGHPMQVHLENQRRGSYVLYTNDGSVTYFDLVGERTVADLGTADLEVHGRPGQRVYLVPEHLTQLPIVVRIATLFPRELDDDGRTTFAPLRTGRYAVGVAGDGFVASAEVTGIGATVSLP